MSNAIHSEQTSPSIDDDVDGNFTHDEVIETLGGNSLEPLTDDSFSPVLHRTQLGAPLLDASSLSSPLSSDSMPSPVNTGASLHVKIPNTAACQRASIVEALQLHHDNSQCSSSLENLHTSSSIHSDDTTHNDSPFVSDDVAALCSVSEDTMATLIADSVSIQRWLVCFGVVNFDLNVGQTLEWCYPHNALNETDASHVCNLSFPDSNVSQLGDSTYCYTLRLSSSSSQLYGVSFFRQQRDESNARGFFQKSVVLLSILPFIELFESVVSIIGPLFFEYGVSLLEAACRNISVWPDPLQTSPTLDLPLLGHVLYADIHAAVIDSFSINRLQFGSFTHVNIFREFRAALGNLWCLWDIIMTGQPLLVAGSCQVQCSRAVLGLISLMTPLPFRGDFRPYFTVSDSEFQHYMSMHTHGHIPCTILGVTNPFFLQAFENFPNILCLGAANTSSTNSPLINAKARCARSNLRGFMRRRKGSCALNVSRNLSSSPILRHMNDAKLISRASPLVRLNADIIEQLMSDRDTSLSEEEINAISLVNNKIIRDHFQNLTVSFLAPFTSYFRALPATLRVSRRTFNPYLDGPRIPSFSEEEFLSNLSSSSAYEDVSAHVEFESRASFTKLYARFMRSPHFLPWFIERRELAQRSIDASTSAAIIESDVSVLINALPLAEAITMKRDILRRQRICLEQLESVNTNEPRNEKNSDNVSTQNQHLLSVLQHHLEVLNTALPPDATDASTASVVITHSVD